ncbi:MAG: hypothetical protein ACTJLM_04940 [Ehrlichia sp.]
MTGTARFTNFLKLRQLFLLLMSIVVFVAALTRYFRSKDSFLPILVVITYVTALLVCKLAIFVKSKKTNLAKKEELGHRKISIFFSCIHGELDKICLTSDIVQLKYDQTQIDGNQEDGITCYVKQKGKFIFSRKFKLQLKNSHYKIFLRDQNTMIVDSGLCIFTTVDPSILDKLMTEEYLLNSIPEIEDGVVWVHYSCLVIVKDTESLKSVLESRDMVTSEYSSLHFARNISVTVYESLLASIFLLMSK